jgi:hypothetical protein
MAEDNRPLESLRRQYEVEKGLDRRLMNSTRARRTTLFAEIYDELFRCVRDCLPEALDCGWAHPSARELAGEIPHGDACRQLRALAKRHGVFVSAGLAEREARSTKPGTRFFNSAVLIDPHGEVILHHRKINELDFARELYSTGDRLGVVETPWGRAGLMICADAFAPGQVISRTLAHMGAWFILSPCAWADRKCIGNSLVCALINSWPRGEVMGTQRTKS